ncbi:site-specific DNA-methyltransferase [Sinorhizobium medicae]|nr:site-specific DNA-methyltransferase [Sinorhizobium medicae]
MEFVEAERGPLRKSAPTSTVGRGKAITFKGVLDSDTYADDLVSLRHGDSLDFYDTWETPQVIVSDGAYGVLGFEGDTSDHTGMAEWYEPHVKCWSKKSTPATTLWFWNSEIGWAAVHPILEKYGFRYQNANIWNKTKAHIAGNVNTAKIRRFPVVTEICVQYVFEARVDGLLLKEWLLKEWKRTGRPVREANTACGVADVAVRKYLDQGHLWYFPPVDMMMKMVSWANEKGRPEGRPYFSIDGKQPVTAEQWAGMRTHFSCPHGVTNVWERPPLKGAERVKTEGTSGKAVHLNQKPLNLMRHIIEASSRPGDVIWEPFGGLFSASLAAADLGRKAFSCEIDDTYFHYGTQRFIERASQPRLHL